MIDCIIFDMDGVLIDSEPLHYKVWKKVFSEYGLTIDFEKYKDCIGSTKSFLYELILKNYGYDCWRNPDLANRFKEVKEQIVKEEGLPEIDGVRKVIHTLHERGYRLAVASSSPLHAIEYTVEKLGLASCFELLCSGEQVKNPKPAPDTFLAVSTKLGISPENCVVIEDSKNGTVAAKAAGMYCLGFANPGSGNQDISAADEIFYPFSMLLEKIEAL